MSLPDLSKLIEQNYSCTWRPHVELQKKTLEDQVSDSLPYCQQFKLMKDNKIV